MCMFEKNSKQYCERYMIDHRIYAHNLSSCEIIKPEKKKSGPNVTRTHDPLWLDSSVVKSLHRYQRDLRFKSRSGLNFPQALISSHNMLKVFVSLG